MLILNRDPNPVTFYLSSILFPLNYGSINVLIHHSFAFHDFGDVFFNSPHSGISLLGA